MRGSDGLTSKVMAVSQRPTSKARDQTDHEPQPHDAGRLAEDERSHLCGARAQRQPDPDLRGALTHGVREHAVQAQPGEPE